MNNSLEIRMQTNEMDFWVLVTTGLRQSATCHKPRTAWNSIVLSGHLIRACMRCSPLSEMRVPRSYEDRTRFTLNLTYHNATTLFHQCSISRQITHCDRTISRSLLIHTPYLIRYTKLCKIRPYCSFFI